MSRADQRRRAAAGTPKATLKSVDTFCPRCAPPTLPDGNLLAAQGKLLARIDALGDLQLVGDLDQLPRRRRFDIDPAVNDRLADGAWHPVAFSSRTLIPAQPNVSVGGLIQSAMAHLPAQPMSNIETRIQ